jgi:hypothetical protein
LPNGIDAGRQGVVKSLIYGLFAKKDRGESSANFVSSSRGAEEHRASEIGFLKSLAKDCDFLHEVVVIGRIEEL